MDDYLDAIVKLFSGLEMASGKKILSGKVYHNNNEELAVKYTIPGVEKDKILVERFENRVEVNVDEIKNIIYLTKKGFNYGEVTAKYKYGILIITIKKEKQKGTKIDLM